MTILLQQRFEEELEQFQCELLSMSNRDSAEELAQAYLDIDPAARSIEEVITCYPGFLAVMAHTLVHEMWQLGKDHSELLARAMAEFIHQQTGFDIHPGAKIGENLVLDHGPVVIGETTIIGNNVTIYQSVTLGAIKVDRTMVGKKRHPTIEDDVTIYANSTILGGDTVIGKGSIVSANSFITNSVKYGPKVEIPEDDCQ